MTPPPATTTSVVTANERSLRRHYPDQVRRSEALGLPLSPPGLPWPELFPAVHPISAGRGAKGPRRRPRRARAMMGAGQRAGGRRGFAGACRRHGRLLAVNDRADVALAAGADVLHLGQDDLPVPVARRILGPHPLIGRSSHSPAQAAATASE